VILNYIHVFKYKYIHTYVNVYAQTTAMRKVVPTKTIHTDVHMYTFTAMRAVVERENQSLRDFEKSFVMAARTSDWDNGI